MTRSRYQRDRFAASSANHTGCRPRSRHGRSAGAPPARARSRMTGRGRQRASKRSTGRGGRGKSRGDGVPPMCFIIGRAPSCPAASQACNVPFLQRRSPNALSPKPFPLSWGSALSFPSPHFLHASRVHLTRKCLGADMRSHPRMPIFEQVVRSRAPSRRFAPERAARSRAGFVGSGHQGHGRLTAPPRKSTLRFERASA